jgi:hypothetical protein
MAKKALADAVVAKLAAEFSLATILNQNEDMEEPQDGTPWVRVDFPVSQNERAALCRRYRETGSFRVVVATQIASGMSDSRTMCEAIDAIFRAKRFGDVETEAPSIRDGIDQGNYLLAAVIVPYRFEYSD